MRLSRALVGVVLCVACVVAHQVSDNQSFAAQPAAGTTAAPPPYLETGYARHVRTSHPANPIQRTVYYSIFSDDYAWESDDRQVGPRRREAEIIDMGIDDELHDEHAYVLIRNTLGPMTVLEAVDAVVEDQDVFMKPVFEALRVLPGGDRITDGQLRALMAPLVGLTGVALADMAEEHPEVFRYDERINVFEDDGMPAQQRAVRALAAAVTSSDDLYELIYYISLPFILTKQTMGGAEGTEVITYTQQHSATTATVYYIYLYTAYTNRVVRIAYFKDTNDPALWKNTLEPGWYAKVPVEWNGADWILSAPITTDRIENLSCDDDLIDIIEASYCDACQSDIGGEGPQDDLTFGNLELSCDNRVCTVTCTEE